MNKHNAKCSKKDIRRELIPGIKQEGGIDTCQKVRKKE